MYTPLDRLVRERIAATGPIGFDELLELALYHPEFGFYSSGGQAGRRGDFLTSPEVGPLFGDLVARALDREWERCDRPQPFVVIDAGAGPGTLARVIRNAQPKCLDAIEYFAVEISEVQRAQHPDWVISTSQLPSEKATGVVIANELLDNLPFTPLRRARGEWTMVNVTVENDRLLETLESCPADVSKDFSNELESAIHQPHAVKWLTEVLTGSLDRGRVIVIDYCRERSADVEVRTYAGHGPAGDPLSELGTKDITVDVDLEQLQRLTRPADVITRQAEWLRDLGIDELVAEGRMIWKEGAADGGLAAIKGRSRVLEAEALCDPAGLGGFTVAEWIIP